MKKMFLVVLAIGMIASTYAKAQKSNYSAFSLSRSPSLSSFKGQIKNLLVKRDNAGWNPTAEKHYLEYFAKKFPGKSPQQIIDGTNWEKIPTGTYLKSVGRISKTTGELSFWGRYSRTNEYQGSYQGIPWTLSDCGNLYPGEDQMLAVVDEEPDDYVDQVVQPRERVIERRVEQQIIQAPAPQIIYVQAPAQAQQIVYTAPPVQQAQYVQQPVMQQQQQMQTQYANNGPQEIIVRQKRDALDYIDLAFKGANTWFNGVNTYRGIRFEQNNQTVNYDKYYSNNTVRPSRPNRPDRPNPTTPPWQYDSGYYPNPYYGNNSNGSGLGTGTGGGTIWDTGNGNTNGNNTGGYTYRAPVSPNRVY